MLTVKQLSKLKKQLIEQKEELTIATADQENGGSIRNSLREATDELSTIDNHPADLATELYDREKDLALSVHSEELLRQVNSALEKMENGTYGVCAKCQELIPYDRLRAIPYTAFCIEHTESKSIATDRPVEEEIILPPVDNSFSNRESHDVLQDDEDSFQEVAQYGNSDTPSDFEGDYDNYKSLYGELNEDMYGAIEILHLSKDEQLNGQISEAYADEARKYDYLED
ncbi:TraR/DksA C4-type zinc finger protein [Solibacillus daqui]|uniref:TraR/DksA C4-type zinc finger protein n=1 Tax=Solibacillus daqui TaxID=2912187 RepID=UPI0023651603|nr:TraR/DksA C4-type zinc finger protein [Solibacillus daqui]